HEPLADGGRVRRDPARARGQGVRRRVRGLDPDPRRQDQREEEPALAGRAPRGARRRGRPRGAARGAGRRAGRGRGRHFHVSALCGTARRGRALRHRGRAGGPGRGVIAELEARAFAAWPAAEVEPLGGWRLRATSGVTRRANSAWTAAAVDDVARSIARAAALYAARAPPPAVRLC